MDFALLGTHSGQVKYFFFLLLFQHTINIRSRNLITLIKLFHNSFLVIYCPRLPQKEVEEILGEAEVLQQFEINKGRKLVPVAGSRCISGILKRNALFRVERSGMVIHEGISHLL